jgi:hypothetical protein
MATQLDKLRRKVSGGNDPRSFMSHEIEQAAPVAGDEIIRMPGLSGCQEKIVVRIRRADDAGQRIDHHSHIFQFIDHVAGVMRTDALGQTLLAQGCCLENYLS